MTQYELINKIFEDNQDKITTAIDKSKFKTTHKTLSYFHQKIEGFLSAFRFFESDGNYYSSQCLARVLFEHFLVANFIFIKCRIEKTDDCGEDYEKYYAIFELMKQENFNSKLDKSYDDKKTPLENFLLKNPKFIDIENPFTQNDVEDINRRSNKFDIRKVLKYFQDEINNNEPFKKTELPLKDICRHYNKLSSYVHGGRTAEIETFELGIIDKPTILRENIEWAEIFSYTILTFKMLLLIDENIELVTIWKPVYDFMKKD